MRSTFILILMLSMVVFTKAQTISGKITETGQKPLSNASISLLNARDSSLVKINATNNNGEFEFNNISMGRYLLLATNVGFAKAYTPVFNFTDTAMVKQNIILEKNSTQMQGVTITAKRPPVEVKAGKTLINVDASPTNAGLNVLEILEKSPGVTVDNDGNVSLKGKGGVMILIDGKQTYLSGQNLAAFLKSIQASGLDQIEIMTNPPAKYDAAGNSGIINIKTKKGVIRGTNGNINLSYAQGLYPKYNGGANLNYRNRKVNIFGNYNGGQWEGFGSLNIKRNFYDKDKNLTGSSDQVTNRHNKSQYHNAKIGVDYYFTDKDVAGVVINANINPWKNWQDGNSNLRNVDGTLNSRFVSAAYNANRSSNITTNLNYKHTFDSTGREISIDLDQGYYQAKGNNRLNTSIYNAGSTQIGSTVLLEGIFPSIIKIYSGKVDYVHPFTKTTKLETGIKSSFVNTDNDVAYRRDIGTGWQIDEQRTNHFMYKENINAAYGTVTSSIKKWEFTGGLRVENTIAEGIQVKNDSSFKRNYTNLFPNAGITYTVNDKNQLAVSYSRRVRRPNYEDLNPFIFFLDSLTYGQGNPYLQPQFSNNVELSHTFNRFLTTSLNYTQTNDIITDLLKQDTEKKTTFQTKENFSKMRQFGVTVTANKPIFKWWNMNVYANVFNNRYNGLYNNGIISEPVEIKVTGLMTNMTNTFSFAKTWTGEISGWYVTNASEGLLIGRSMGGLNAALAKQVFKKNGTLKIGIRDILRTNNFRGYTRYGDVDVDVFNDRRRDNRQFNISFTYKFGKNNIAPARRRTGGAGDELNRIGSGGN